MSVNPSNLALGPGAIFVGDTSATEPADTAVALAADPSTGWTGVGGTLGGATFTVTQTFKELEVDQVVETPERRVTKREASLKTSLAEVTFDNLVLALNSGTITLGTSGAPDVYVPSNVNSGSAPTYKAAIFDTFAGAGKKRRIILRKCLSTENVDVSASKDGQAAYPVTLTTHYVSSSIASYKVLTATA